MPRKRYELRQAPDDQWGLYKSGADRASKKFETKEEGLEFSRGYVRAQGNSQLVVKRIDESVQTEHTYDNDPFPPPGDLAVLFSANAVPAASMGVGLGL